MIDELDMNELELQLKRWVYHLDEKAVSMEAKWGIGRLQAIITPDLKDKWYLQNEKMNAALVAKKLNLYAELVNGAIRGWDVLEANALEHGHKPNDAEYLTAKFDGGEFEYHIYRNGIDVRQPPVDGVVRYTLEEVARILETHQLVNVIKHAMGGGEVREIKPRRVEEDDLPW